MPLGTIVGYNHITTGKYVTLAQRALNNVYSLDSTYREDFSHCSCGTVDGIFGQRTYQAVYYFQSAVGLSPDGIVGDNTWSGFSYYCL